MKIAIASDNGIVTQHFGHCQGFQIYNVIENEILAKEFIPNPGHKPGFLPRFLHDHKVNVIIAGGMGASAIKIFNDHNIDVIIGCVGKTDDIIKQYLDGLLHSSGSACHEHLHHCE